LNWLLDGDQLMRDFLKTLRCGEVGAKIAIACLTMNFGALTFCKILLHRANIVPKAI
jgi:hypothetical protein